MSGPLLGTLHSFLQSLTIQYYYVLQTFTDSWRCTGEGGGGNWSTQQQTSLGWHCYCKSLAMPLIKSGFYMCPGTSLSQPLLSFPCHLPSSQSCKHNMLLHCGIYRNITPYLLLEHVCRFPFHTQRGLSGHCLKQSIVPSTKFATLIDCKISCSPFVF